MSNLSVIISREFNERVKKKSFIITTLLMPVLMIALMCIPALLSVHNMDDTRSYLVVDCTTSKIFAQNLKSGKGIEYIPTDLGLDSALTNQEVSAILFLPSDILDNRNAKPRVYNNASGSMTTESVVNSDINNVITEYRINSYDIANLKDVIKDIESDLTLQTFDNKDDEQEASSTTISYIMGLLLSLLLYMAILMYGQMVMTSIIEEKNNRVLELIVTSVKPFQLMLGKITGVGLVAITQMVIWGILIVCGSTILLPMLMPADIMSQVSSFQAGNIDTAGLNGVDMEMIGIMAKVTDVGYVTGLLFWLLVFLIGGFLLYASIFAAIGSAVDNVQDASQLSSLAVIPIILGIMFGSAAANIPDSTMSIVTSFVPFTSPMVMMSRLPFGVPVWQTALSAVTLFASVVLFIWLAGKIYRVGIFMYGKKPKPAEIIRWISYK